MVSKKKAFAVSTELLELRAELSNHFPLAEPGDEEKDQEFQPPCAQGEGWEGVRVAEQRGDTDPTWNIFAAPKSAVISVNNTQGSVKMELKHLPAVSLGLASPWDHPGSGQGLSGCSSSITPGL